MRALVFVVVGLLAVGCKKDDKSSTPATNDPKPASSTGGTTADGVRKVPVEVTAEAYKPERISGKPGEKLILVFTRHDSHECTSQVRTPDGKLYNLPEDKPFEVPVTVPQQGEVKFACGMDMITGVIVAEKG
jgi:plastocyanin domain-containing protein